MAIFFNIGTSFFADAAVLLITAPLQQAGS
jgi:hypothetical protein